MRESDCASGTCDNFQDQVQLEDVPESTSLFNCCSTDTVDLISFRNVKTQTDNPQTRTRRLQTRTVAFSEIGIQCNLLTENTKEAISLFGMDETEIEETPMMISSSEDEDLLDAQEYDDSSDAFTEMHQDLDMDPDFYPESEMSEESEDGDESGSDGPSNYKLEETDDPCQEKYYLVSESCLKNLLSTCKSCGESCTSFIEFTKGSLIATSSVCTNGHVRRWQSQSLHNKLPWGKLLIASAIVFSGNITSKVLRMFQHMKVQMISASTAARLQSAYTIPATIEEFDSKQADIITSLGGKLHASNIGHIILYIIKHNFNHSVQY